jgi:hypothetical protein
MIDEMYKYSAITGNIIGAKSLEYRRLINPKYKSDKNHTATKSPKSIQSPLIKGSDNF